jgi:hypothetical protein
MSSGGRALSRGKEGRATESPTASRHIRVTIPAAPRGTEWSPTTPSRRLVASRLGSPAVLLFSAAGVPGANQFGHFANKAFAELASAAPRAPLPFIAPTADLGRSPTGEDLGAASPGAPAPDASRPARGDPRRRLLLICCLLRPPPPINVRRCGSRRLRDNPPAAGPPLRSGPARSKLRLGVSVAARRISAHTGGG